MKVLFDHPNPFLLAHGGFQIQIEQTRAALERIGVEVEYLRWWDDAQRGDIIHFFGRPMRSYVDFAHQKNLKVVVADLLTSQGSRSARALATQRAVMRVSERVLPEAFRMRLAWDAYRRADACVALTEWEAQLMQILFNAPREKVHVVPNGVEDNFLELVTTQRGKWLICTAVITERKRVLELAQAAVQAQTPVWIIGRPYSESDSYARQFQQFTKEHSDYIRYEGPVSDRKKLAQIYREARGFVLLSTMESLSLSALEAAACRAPLLLSDLPWARTVFGSSAHYCSIAGKSETANCLKHFYQVAPTIEMNYAVKTWVDVARQLRGIYETLLSSSR